MPPRCKALILLVSSVLCAEARPARMAYLAAGGEGAVKKSANNNFAATTANGTAAALTGEACPAGDFLCRDNIYCCPNGAFCGTGSDIGECFACAAGAYLCPDASGCCPSSYTCGTGSQADKCTKSSPVLASWAIALIVTIPIVVIAACVRFCVMRRKAAAPSFNEAFVPAANPAYGAQPVYNGAQPVYNGAPPYQAAAPPTSYQDGGARQEWR